MAARSARSPVSANRSNSRLSARSRDVRGTRRPVTGTGARAGAGASDAGATSSVGHRPAWPAPVGSGGATGSATGSEPGADALTALGATAALGDGADLPSASDAEVAGGWVMRSDADTWVGTAAGTAVGADAPRRVGVATGASGTGAAGAGGAAVAASARDSCGVD